VSTFVKVMVALLLTLPLGAYVTGTLVASRVDAPVTRVPVVLDSGAPTGTPGPPDARPSTGPDDNGRGDDDRWDDDDDVRVVRPTPHDVDDDHGGDRRDDRHGGDRRDDRRDDDGADDG